jgi:CubicO group peptidase (beta-lactamase class C family)
VKRAAAVVVLLVTLVGCSSHAEVAARASRDLQSRVDMIRTAADSGDVEGAQVALRQLERAVARWQRRGELSTDRAGQILDAAGNVASALGALIPTTAPSSSPSFSPSESPKPQKSGKSDKHGNGHAFGHEGGD